MESHIEEGKDTEEGFYAHTPYNFYGKSYRQNDNERTVLAGLRRWIKNEFTKYQFVDPDKMDTLDQLRHDVYYNKNKAKNITNMLCRVDLKTTTGDHSALQVRDHKGGLWSLQIMDKKHPGVNEGDLILLKRVQATYLKEEQQPKLEIVRKSNLLRFLDFSGDKHELQAIFDDLDQKQKILVEPELSMDEAR